jgi:hypothetical protein
MGGAGIINKSDYSLYPVSHLGPRALGQAEELLTFVFYQGAQGLAECLTAGMSGVRRITPIM